MSPTPHYLVGCSYAPDAHLTDEGLPTWHVRDTDTGRIVARFAVASHARDWAELLLNAEGPRDEHASPLFDEPLTIRHPSPLPRLDPIDAREIADHDGEAEAEWREQLA